MNRFAYLIAGFAVKTLSNLLKAKVNIYDKDNIPKGPTIFVINHFTRIETLLIPYHIFKLINVPVWSLADDSLFKGALGAFIHELGAVSTKDPERDILIVKSLLTGEAAWIIFPEGRMVKNKKIIEKGRFIISHAGGRYPPHTGAATLALRAEFYRQRLHAMSKSVPDEAKRLMNRFQIDSIASVSKNSIHIVPVNITYYPIRARENILNKLTAYWLDDIPERMAEEIMTEGTMLLSGVDMDIRFGKPIEAKKILRNHAVARDISTTRSIHFDDPIPAKKTMRRLALKVMHRYMSAIYSMTTVNLDHLFASILIMIPFKKIDERDLRRRAYWAATFILNKTNVYVHKSLRTDQLHLLTDDSQNRFKDFISVALEKGVVKQTGSTLVKSASKLSHAFDFHRIRIDNPVSVIANEVEPLTFLQWNLRRAAWIPGFWLKRTIVKHLKKKAAVEFEKDYNAFYMPGESKNKNVGMPFLVKGNTAKIGVVLIHGYMAAPLEVKGLADYLGRKGLWVYVPRLKGHGTSPEDLAKRTYKDWMDSVGEGYAVISNLCEHVIVGGFSTGAGLALDLAAEVNDIKGVFAVCPPMRLQDFSSKFVPAVDAWNRIMERIHIDGVKKEFVENKPENPHINYLRNPVAGIREIDRLMHRVEPKLPDIQTPALVLQSRGDPVVDPKGSERVFELLGSKDKDYLLFNFDRHGILLGEGAQQVYKAILKFIRRLF